MGNRSPILIVNDNEISRGTLAMILEEKGYFVDMAETGEEAIQKSRASFCNLAPICIRLLTEMGDTIPRMVKIMMAGYPTLENTIEMVDGCANRYMREIKQRQKKERKREGRGLG